MLRDPKPPCRGCTKRHAGCHPKCPDYLNWNTEHQAFREEQRKSQEVARNITDTLIQRHLKNKYSRKNKRRFGK